MAGATPFRGRPLRRFEDERLLRGEGAFVDDMQLPGMLHAAVLRSPHAHARIRSVDTSRARAMSGVAAVLTGADAAGVLPSIAAVRREGMGCVWRAEPHDAECRPGPDHRYLCCAPLSRARCG